MSETIYKKYGNYFISKFKNDSRLRYQYADIKNKERFAVEISTGRADCFISIIDDGILIEGTAVYDVDYECVDLAKEPEEEIYKFLDEQAECFQKMLGTGIIMLAYQGLKCVTESVIDVKDRAKMHERYNDFVNFDIRLFYDKNKRYKDLPFEEITRIELQDLYGETLYEYKVEDEEKVLEMARYNNLRRQKDYSIWAYKNSEEYRFMVPAFYEHLRKRQGIEFYQADFDVEEFYNKVRLREIEKYPAILQPTFDKISKIELTANYVEKIVFERPNGDMSQKMVLKNPLEESQDE